MAEQTVVKVRHLDVLPRFDYYQLVIIVQACHHEGLTMTIRHVTCDDTMLRFTLPAGNLNDPVVSLLDSLIGGAFLVFLRVNFYYYY